MSGVSSSNFLRKLPSSAVFTRFSEWMHFSSSSRSTLYQRLPMLGLTLAWSSGSWKATHW